MPGIPVWRPYISRAFAVSIWIWIGEAIADTVVHPFPSSTILSNDINEA